MPSHFLLRTITAAALLLGLFVGSSRTTSAQGQAAAAVNISGEWVVYVATPNAAPWRGALEQRGAKIVGYMSNETAEYPVTGTIEGDQVKFSWSVYEAGDKVEIKITGKFDKEAITGTANVGDIEEVEATAQRTAK